MSVEAGSQVVLTKPVRQPGQRRSLGSYLAMPLILAAICLAMYLYVATKDLDSIEARALSPQRLGTALWQHIQLTVVSTALTLIIAVPLGVLLTRGFMRRVQPVLITVLTLAGGPDRRSSGSVAARAPSSAPGAAPSSAVHCRKRRLQVMAIRTGAGS